jgi:hypothetical protein
MKHAAAVTLALTGLSAFGCNPVHRVGINAVPAPSPARACVAAALAPLGAVQLSSCFEAIGPDATDAYGIPDDGGVILVHMPASPGADTSPATFSWSASWKVSDVQIAEGRRRIEAVYNDVRARCGGLPAITEAKYECSGRGCRR